MTLSYLHAIMACAWLLISLGFSLVLLASIVCCAWMAPQNLLAFAPWLMYLVYKSKMQAFVLKFVSFCAHSVPAGSPFPTDMTFPSLPFPFFCLLSHRLY